MIDIDKETTEKLFDGYLKDKTATIKEHVEKRCPTKKRVKLKPFYATMPIDMNNREEIGIWEHDLVMLENMYAEVFAKRNREKRTRGK